MYQSNKRKKSSCGNLFILAAVFLLFCHREVPGQKLFVFIPGRYKPVYIEKRMKEHLSDIDVRAFGSVRDFKTIVKNETPEMIITKTQVADFFKNYMKALQAEANGTINEAYYLLSVGSELKPEDVSGKTIGILDFLGRKEIKTFVTELLKIEPGKINRVKKDEDLLSLITLDMVDGIIVSERQYAYIKEKSQLDFHKVQCSKKMPIAVLAVSSDDDAVVKKIKTMPDELKEILGFDSWK